MRSEELEKYSSAITLSDMEVFVFPELMYSLVLANIMSPVIWKWREEETFKKLEGKTPYRRLMRMRQFIMDQYEFNLDLETWGMTDQQRELERFSPFIPSEDITRSNALFGYTGDKYYFDVDIRRHFGLDKYGDDAIPYWKTETAEAMNAFVHRDEYTKAAGECVSLSTLYAAAAFVLCGVPLEDIFLVLTPLHSQNFIDFNGGVVTNNRRVVTKPMWYNGTAITMKAQRALKNEQVTIVSHSSGHVHCMYDEATIDAGEYGRFREKLGEYLTADFNMLMFGNFLRGHGEYQKYFQFCREHRGQKKFIKAEILYRYEHGSNFRIAEETFDKLLEEVSEEDYSGYKHVDRMCCQQLMAFAEYEKVDIQTSEGREKVKEYLRALLPDADEFMDKLWGFLHIDARLPGVEKEYVASEPICLSADMSREEVIEYLQSMRDKSSVADLAFYAYRDMARCEWGPFVKAAIERNPVSIAEAEDKQGAGLYCWLARMVNESIYDGTRIAQPDEVVNFKRGDGVEKAITMANILRSRGAGEIEIVVDRHDVVVRSGGQEWRFVSAKGLEQRIVLAADGGFSVK